jgi:hypothetical protein
LTPRIFPAIRRSFAYMFSIATSLNATMAAQKKDELGK